MANIIGEPLLKYVVNQINTRQKIHGSGTPDNPRTPEYISYLNSKSAWIKMASGVAVKPERLASEKDSFGNSIRDEYSWMELAKNFVLFDGVSRLNGNVLNPRGTSTTANNVWDWYEGTYNISSTFDNNSTTGEFGLTPMPGIESVDVKCQNRGSTKKVSVKLKCFSPEQFKVIDLLYLRIGYTMFIEWGWNPYMENSSNMVSDYFTLIEQGGQGFFDWTYWKSKSYLGFLKRIESTRAKHRGNYDGILCRVTNFSWTFSQDGSYDIDIELISLGDVVESLKTNITPSYQVSKFIDEAYKIFNDDYDEEETKDAPPSAIDNIISAYFFVQKLIVYQNREKGGTYKYWEQRQIPIYAGGQSLNLCSIFVKGLASGPLVRVEISPRYDTSGEVEKWVTDNYPNATKLTTEEAIQNATATGTYYFVNKSEDENSAVVKDVLDPKDFETDDKNPKDIVYFNYNTQKDDEDTLNDEGFYIRFGHLLEYIDQFVLPKIEGTSGTTGEASILNIDSGQWSNKMYTLPFQVSLDPRVCVVHTKEKVNSKEYYTSLPVWKNENKGYAYPMNIYLSFNKVNELISSNLDEEGNLGLFDFISSICTEVNKALGGINNLEPVIDETTNTLRIIDGSYSVVNSDPGYALELFGYNPNNPNGNGKTMSNFVRNFSIKTEITNDFATMASVGSTAGGYVKGVENTMFSKWNKGLIDRFKEKLIPGDTNSRIKSGEKPEASEMYYTEFWNRKYSAFGLTIPIDIEDDLWTGDQPSLLPEAIDRNVSIVTEFYKYCQAVLQEKREKYASPTNGFIPISLGLTLDGISGIKIYNALNVVTRVLPQNYPNSLKFIVKGVNHKISQNDWETNIETVVIAQNEDENKSIFTYEEIYSIIRTLILEGKADAEETTFEEVNEVIRNAANGNNPDGTSANESTAPTSAPTFKDCATIPSPISPKPFGIVKSSTLDYVELLKIVIDNQEGNYYHPFHAINTDTNQFIDGYSVMYDSGETLWGIDRAAGAHELTTEGQYFWKEVDKISGFGAYGYIKPGDKFSFAGNKKTGITRKWRKWRKDNKKKGTLQKADAWTYNTSKSNPANNPELFKYATENFITPKIKYYIDLYFNANKSPNAQTVKNLVENDGRLLYMYIRSWYSGIGHMQKDVNSIIKIYDSGVRDIETLACKELAARYERRGNESHRQIKVLIGLK